MPNPEDMNTDSKRPEDDDEEYEPTKGPKATKKRLLWWEQLLQHVRRTIDRRWVVDDRSN
jgi:hypothetical protein